MHKRTKSKPRKKHKLEIFKPHAQLERYVEYDNKRSLSQKEIKRLKKRARKQQKNDFTNPQNSENLDTQERDIINTEVLQANMFSTGSQVQKGDPSEIIEKDKIEEHLKNKLKIEDSDSSVSLENRRNSKSQIQDRRTSNLSNMAQPEELDELLHMIKEFKKEKNNRAMDKRIIEFCTSTKN